MDPVKTVSRIHPLMAAAAVSIIVVSLAGTAAITGMLPSSHGAQEAVPAALLTSTQAAAPYGAAYAQPTSFAQAQPGAMNVAQAYPVANAQPAPVVIKETVIKEVPAKPAHAVRHHTSYARNDAPAYYQPAPPPAQPNYVAIGTGAVVGGLIGNQVGSGNGRKLATIAGMIGGGYLGNQMANGSR